MVEAYAKIKAAVKFLYCELSENLTFSTLETFDWVIIGSRCKNTTQPQWKWIENLMQQARKANCKIYFKSNLTIRPKEYPFVEDEEAIDKKKE